MCGFGGRVCGERIVAYRSSEDGVRIIPTHSYLSATKKSDDERVWDFLFSCSSTPLVLLLPPLGIGGLMMDVCFYKETTDRGRVYKHL